ncbi:type VI secretion system baseplate subunit TssE [Iodobacter fluviatilis]|uniref:Type VI secretion system baseplate subunit TssE n=1 Tax=Iodobacter fluviatilis TaxID=537 RepID=A0A7G3GE18_9NEIS|nr:type VI secretion system baseplate subunit TssE [Iodobacter fluviatilis]QBC44925.1 type VI secretion system baseplate subunit TssE [Iodobacter fluviatilis]
MQTDPFRVPLFERLQDDAPHSAEITPHRQYGKAAVMTSVCNELSRILNTRRESMPRLAEHSIIDYGIADWSGFKTGFDADRRQFIRDIKQAISVFEPRLKDVQIEIFSTDGRSATLSIFAELRGTQNERAVLCIKQTEDGMSVEEVDA